MTATWQDFSRDIIQSISLSFHFFLTLRNVMFSVMPVRVQVPPLVLPSTLPPPDAMKAFGGGRHSYDPDCWEFEYQIYRYLGRVDDVKLVKRHQQIVRNMQVLTTSDRNVIPIASFLSSWFWYRKEHQTRFEFLLRGKTIEPPRIDPDRTAKWASRPPPRPKHPNAGDILFRYGKENYLRPALQQGVFRVFR